MVSEDRSLSMARAIFWRLGLEEIKAPSTLSFTAVRSIFSASLTRLSRAARCRGRSARATPVERM